MPATITNVNLPLEIDTSEPVDLHAHLRAIILAHPDFCAFQVRVNAVFNAWRDAHEQTLRRTTLT